MNVASMGWRKSITRFALVITIVSLALQGILNGETMTTTRDQLNSGIASLSSTAGVLEDSYSLIVGAVNLKNGSMVALGPVSGPKGTVVAVPINFIKGKGAVSGLQFDVLFPSTFTFQSIVIGPAGTAAGKSISSNPISGGVRILVFGLNQTLLGTGFLATLNLSVSATSLTGPISLGIANVSASNPTGVGVPLTVSTGTVTVQ